MLRVLIVDDEPLARRAMRRLLQPHAVQIVGEAEGIRDTMEQVHALHPDLIFLDIELNDGDGFDLLAALENPPRVVFVTAYAAHAVEAFAVAAVDYLLKPVAPERLAEALERVRRQVAQKPDRTQDGVLDLRTPTRSVRAAPSDIAAVRADGDFCHVLLADQPALMIWRTLGHFEQLLPVPPFLRLDRSLIVNLDRLRQIETRSRDEVRLFFSGLGEPLAIGRTAATRLKEATAGRT